MRRVWAAALVVTLLAGCGRMREYTPAEGDFRITLPGTPIEETDAQGPVYKVMDRHEEHRISYIVRRIAIPGDDAGVGDERLFDGFQASGVASIAGSLKGSRTVTSRGAAHLGREFAVEAETKVTGDPYQMIWRVFRVGPTLYVLQATTARGAERRAEAVAVLDTFALLK